MLNKERLRIGDWVYVTKQIKLAYDDQANRILKTQDIPGAWGQIVGVKKILAGKRRLGNEDEPTLFLQSGVKQLVWLVRFGMINQAIMVDDDHIDYTAHQFPPKSKAGKRTVEGQVFRDLPWFYCPQPKFSEKEIETLREEAKKRKRANGKFVKEEKRENQT